MDDTAIREAYSDFIQEFPWDNFVTVTFRRPRRDRIAAASSVWGSMQKLGASRAFVAVEPAWLTGDIHVHALSRQYPHLWKDPATQWKYLSKAYGRTTVEPINDLRAVSSYVAKYVVKGNSYTFLGDKDSWTQDDDGWKV